MNKIKYGIIGAGTMAREHINNISIIEDAEVVALSDPDDHSLEKSKKIAPNEIKIFNNYIEMAEANLADVFLISSPNFTHYGIVKDLIKYNKHFLIEKPLCTNTADCIDLKKITENYKSIVWIGMEYRYMPPVAKFIQNIHNNKIGDLKMLSIREHREPFLVKVNDWNRLSKNTGGTLVEKCCHFFDLMRYIIKSDPIQVYASGGQDVNHLDEEYNGEKSDILDNAYVIVDFANKVRASLDLCMFAENSNFQEELSAVGTKGKIETGVPSSKSGINKSEVFLNLRNKITPDIETIEVDNKILQAGHHHGSTYYEHLKFLDCIKNKSNPEVSLNDGLIAVATGEAAEKSIKENRVVKMSEFNL